MLKSLDKADKAIVDCVKLFIYLVLNLRLTDYDMGTSYVYGRSSIFPSRMGLAFEIVSLKSNPDKPPKLHIEQTLYAPKCSR